MRAVFPHAALRSVVSSSGLARLHSGLRQGEPPPLSKVTLPRPSPPVRLVFLLLLSPQTTHAIGFRFGLLPASSPPHPALARRRCGRGLGRDTDSPLWRTVQNGLRCHWSPEQIAGKLPRMNKAAMQAGLAMPEQPMSVSHETIYCAIYAMPRSTLRTELVGLLRQSHKTRLP